MACVVLKRTKHARSRFNRLPAAKEDCWLCAGSSRCIKQRFFPFDLKEKPPKKSNNIKKKKKGTSAIDAAAHTTCTATFDAIGATTAVTNRPSLLARFAAAYFDAVPTCEPTPSAATASPSLPSTFERTRKSYVKKNKYKQTVHFQRFFMQRISIYLSLHPIPPFFFFKFPLNYIYNCYDRFLQLFFFSLSFCFNIWWWAHQNLATCLNSFGQLWLLLFFFFADVIPADYQNALPIIMVVTIQGWYFVPS